MLLCEYFILSAETYSEYKRVKQ